MAVRYRSATPGVLLSLVAVILLAIVSFNTPLLKSLYFLQANYSSGQYAGTITLGTLGYCLDFQGQQSCVGPRVGYEFNPNALFGVDIFNIPETITKYLTYTLILHIVALACAGLSLVFGLLSCIQSMAVMCFPTCFAGMASSFSLLALVFDLVIFYITRARINAVAGASASIGISVWLVLAAWLVSGFAGCAYGVGRCCVGSRNRQEGGDPKNPGNYYNRSQGDEMRLHAIRDEQARKKEQGLPSFQELERTPLTNDGEDKFLYEENPMPGSLPKQQGLRRDGSVVNGVGMGYGRRADPNAYGGAYGGAGAAGGLTAGAAAGAAAGAYAGNGYGQHGQYDAAYGDLSVPVRQGSGSAASTAGAAGLGAGGGGVERPQEYGYAYNDPYQANQYGHDQYAQQQYGDRSYGQQDQYGHDQYDQNHAVDQYGQAQYSDNTYGGNPHQYRETPSPMPVPQPSQAQAGYNQYSAQSSAENYNPNHDPYEAYDDGLGAIGANAQRDVGRHQSDYTGAYDPNSGAGYNTDQIHQPAPQHLASSQSNNILRSPASAVGGNAGRSEVGYGGDEYEEPMGRPPSYDAGAAGSSYAQRPEKSRYQHQ